MVHPGPCLLGLASTSTVATRNVLGTLARLTCDARPKLDRDHGSGQLEPRCPSYLAPLW